MPAIVLYGAYAAATGGLAAAGGLAAIAAGSVSAIASGASIVAGAAYVAGSIKGGAEGQKWRNAGMELGAVATAVTAFAPQIESGLAKVGLKGAETAASGANAAGAATTAADMAAPAASDAQILGASTPTAGPLAAPSAPISGLNQAGNISNEIANTQTGLMSMNPATPASSIAGSGAQMTPYQAAHIDSLNRATDMQGKGLMLDAGGKLLAGQAAEDQAKWQNEQNRIAAEKLAQERDRNNRIAYMTQGNVNWR